MKPTSLNLRCPWTKEAQLGNVGIGQMLSLRLSTSSLAITRQNVFSPPWLFNNGEVGWFEPMIAGSGGTLFQDSAGTTPVTAPGQPVGLSKFTAGGQLGFVQPTALNRPIYGIHPITGRRNLLTYTEDFGNAAWVKGSATITANSGVSPDGSFTADTFIPNSGQVGATAGQLVTVSQTQHVVSFYAKAAGQTSISLISNLTGPFRANVFNLATETATPGTGWTGSITAVGNGWYRCSCTATADAAGSKTFQISNNSAGWTGDGTSGILIWGAQLELGSTATAYQKVVSQYEVTEAGVQSIGYLSHNGSNQWMSTSAFAWGSDKATIVAGVRKLSDAAAGTVLELSADSSTNAGAILIRAPWLATGNQYGFTSRGTATVFALSGAYVAPTTNVLTGIGDIAADTAILRINGSQVAQSTSDQGTGNYGTYALYAGARGGTSLFFNGNRYPNMGINRLLTAAELAQVEAWVNSKTGAY